MAAAERTRRVSEPDRGRRPMVIAAATGVLLVAGAGALAVARTDAEPRLVEPEGAAAPFGVDYVDGFGEHSPPPPRGKPSKRPAVIPSVTPVVTSPGVPSPDGSTDIVVDEAPPTQLSAVYWLQTGGSSYMAYLWVHNDGEAAVDWEVRIGLPAGATVDRSLGARRESGPDNVWIFKSTSGDQLRPNGTYLFAVQGKRPSGSFRLTSCTVTGGTCTAFG